MPKRILLIDSDESFAQGLAAAANAGGFKALTATNSEQGMAQMAARLLGAPAAGDEEMVAIDDESLGLGNQIASEDEPIQLGEEEAAEAHSANDDPLVELEELVEMDDAPAPVPARGDEDLDMFDQAFDALKPAGGSGRLPVEK